MRREGREALQKVTYFDLLLSLTPLGLYMSCLPTCFSWDYVLNMTKLDNTTIQKLHLLEMLKVINALKALKHKDTLSMVHFHPYIILTQDVGC